MTHEEQRLFLIKELLKEEIRYRGADIPADEQEQKDLLRSLMNVREPKPLKEEFLKIQNEYLTEEATRRGIIDVNDLPATETDNRLILWQGDITRLKASAIVNAANSAMLGCFQPLHSCIDNIIHSCAGLELRDACHRQMTKIRERVGANYMQPTGIPMITDAYNLPADHVIHVVGPIVDGTLTDTHRAQLASCYRNTLILCEKQHLASVVFCCISTGVFSFPNREAAEIATDTVRTHLTQTGSNIKVIFNVFKDEDLTIYRDLLSS